MNARERALEASPRRRVRYVYLIEAWPEGAQLDHLDAFLDAPDSAVIAALVREVDVYSDAIQAERARRVEAEAKLARLEEAVALVLDAGRGQLAMVLS